MAEWRETELVVGIDLGTTNSVIAYWDRDRPRVYKPYHDSFLLPSVVFREPDGGWVVGRVAQRNRALHPSRVFRSLKRHLWDPEFRAIVAGVEYTPAQLSAQILAKLQEIAQAA
ncbi:MAG: Hsp70 family protein, partial [Deinococcus sp.]|nr:Hsp70 family protein [Deinococcus sp.]